MFRYVLLGGLAVALTMSFASTAEARRTHLIADASLTPKRRDAERRLSPPRTTASITRSRKS